MTSPTTTDALAATEAEAYLARIGAAAPEAPTAGALASLHRAHLMAVPFENLDISLGRPIRLDLASVLAKVVEARRGGYCYELNGLFAALLRHLGYAVDLVSARVATSGGGLTDDFDHVALIVTSPELHEPVLADVGFGAGFTEPLPLRHRFTAHEAGKEVGVVREGDDWHYRERPDGGEWQTRFVFTTTPRALTDFDPRNLWQQTSPDSHFVRGRVASVLTPTGRTTLSDNRLITTTHGHRHEVELAESEVPAALWQQFGIVLH
ncbi:MAG TPA: arylamine N-acetyltransferase [Humibacillus sp.]|nr:arylamine N-acetyltransferase [Humibacillus sp.]